jgi:hypothetical protein
VDKFFTINPSPIIGTFVVQGSIFDNENANDILVTADTYDYKWICKQYSKEVGIVDGISARFRNIYILRRLIIDFFIRIIDNVSRYALNDAKSHEIKPSIGEITTLKLMERIRREQPEKRQEALLNNINRYLWGHTEIGGARVLGIYDYICENLNKPMNGNVDNETRQNRNNIYKLLSVPYFKKDIDEKIALRFKNVSFTGPAGGRQTRSRKTRARKTRRRQTKNRRTGGRRN